VETVQKTPPAQLEQLQNLPPSQQFPALAKVAGFQDWAAMRGVPVAKSSQCLSNENSVNQLVQMTSDATTQFPEFQGTPTFVINGKMLEQTATWDKLEPQLKSAVGG
jgi:protein-disulfide isomerase